MKNPLNISPKCKKCVMMEKQCPNRNFFSKNIYCSERVKKLPTITHILKGMRSKELSTKIGAAVLNEFWQDEYFANVSGNILSSLIYTLLQYDFDHNNLSYSHFNKLLLEGKSDSPRYLTSISGGKATIVDLSREYPNEIVSQNSIVINALSGLFHSTSYMHTPTLFSKNDLKSVGISVAFDVNGDAMVSYEATWYVTSEGTHSDKNRETRLQQDEDIVETN